MPEATIDETYRVGLRSVGFIDPTWSVTGLPAGLELVDDVIRGVPTALGTSQVTLAVVDAFHSRTAELALTVSADSRTGGGVPPGRHQRLPLSSPIDGAGKGTGYTWSGSAANGLVIAADGQVSGIPQQAGATRIPVTITSSSGEARHFLMPIRVNPPPVIASEQVIQGRVGEALAAPDRSHWRYPTAALAGDRFDRVAAAGRSADRGWAAGRDRPGGRLVQR